LAHIRGERRLTSVVGAASVFNGRAGSVAGHRYRADEPVTFAYNSLQELSLLSIIAQRLTNFLEPKRRMSPFY
jgi:hypothetical protein